VTVEPWTLGKLNRLELGSVARECEAASSIKSLHILIFDTTPTAMSVAISAAACCALSHVNLRAALLKMDFIHECSHQVNASAMGDSRLSMVVGSGILVGSKPFPSSLTRIETSPPK
jgi:hypothetical protein